MTMDSQSDERPDAELAQEIAQNVFAILARKAGGLKATPTLAGWLHRVTMVECSTSLRQERQRADKMKDFAEHTRIEADGDSIWSEACPHLDDAIDELSPGDRDLLELIAREIHHRSKRHEGPMVRVNCATIPKELYESEFFGHVRGAFTGAVKDRAGRFATADGGTLFLDEIGEIPLDLQSKLLRVLQEGTYERVGDERSRTVNTRIVAATNRDLEKEVEAGRFRQDLYYRINVFPVSLPPLRDRREDIPVLANHFLKEVAMKLNRPRPKLTQGNVAALQGYDWPGNIRELQNLMERAVITSRQGRLIFDLPRAAKAHTPLHSKPSADESEETVYPEAEMRRRECENLERALTQTNWKVYGSGGAAELLGIKPTTLMSRIRKFELEKPRR